MTRLDGFKGDMCVCVCVCVWRVLVHWTSTSSKLCESQACLWSKLYEPPVACESQACLWSKLYEPPVACESQPCLWHVLGDLFCLFARCWMPGANTDKLVHILSGRYASNGTHKAAS